MRMNYMKKKKYKYFYWFPFFEMFWTDKKLMLKVINVIKNVIDTD